MWKIAKRGDKLTHEMLGRLRSSDQSEKQIKKLEKHWNFYKDRRGGNKLCKAVLRAYASNLVLTSLIILVDLLIELISPLVLYYVMRFLQNPDDTDYWRGSLLMGGLLIAQYISFFVSEHAAVYCDVQGIKAEIVLIGLITQKSLKSSPSASKVFSQGEIVNRLSNDTSNLKQFFERVSKVITIIIALILGSFAMYNLLGVSAVAGAGPLVIIIIINAILAKKIADIEAEFMDAEDYRIELTTEAIHNIKTIKLTGWETLFLSKIKQAREKELSLQKKFYILDICSDMVIYLAPVLLIGTMLTVFIVLGHTVQPSIVFTILLIFENIKGELYEIPYIIGSFVQAYTSMKRIEEYLMVEQVQPALVHKRPQDPFQYALQIQNASFTWRNKEEDD